MTVSAAEAPRVGGQHATLAKKCFSTPPLFQMWGYMNKQIIMGIKCTEIRCRVVTFLSNSGQKRRGGSLWGEFMAKGLTTIHVD